MLFIIIDVCYKTFVALDVLLSADVVLINYFLIHWSMLYYLISQNISEVIVEWWDMLRPNKHAISTRAVELTC